MSDRFHFRLNRYADDVLFTDVETAPLRGTQAFLGVAHERICVSYVAEAGAIVLYRDHRGVAIGLRLNSNAAFGGKWGLVPGVLDQFLDEIPGLAIAVELAHPRLGDRKAAS